MSYLAESRLRQLTFGVACAVTAAIATACHDTPAAIVPLPICNSTVTISVDTSVLPVISWSPACAATGIRVDLETDTAIVPGWSIAATGAEGILPNVAYGEVRSDAMTQTTPLPLRTGFSYRVTVFGGTAAAPVSLGKTDFRPVQHVDGAFQMHVAMPDTVYGRAFAISFTYAHSRDATLYIDEGTPTAVVLASTRYLDVIRHCTTEWDLDFPPLPNGRHNYRIDVLDSAGHVGSMTGSFVISIPSRPYHLTYLGVGADSSDALAINQAGTVVGWTATAHAAPQAALWSSGRVSQVPTASTYTTSRAVDVNSHDVAALMFTTPGTTPCKQGGLWTTSGVSPLFAGRCDISELTAINDSNVVVGAYAYAYPDGRTVGDQYSFHDARDINNKGQIVGRTDDVYDGQAASWTLNITLPRLIPRLYACTGFASPHYDNRYDRVNDLGQAIGWASYANPYIVASDNSLIATPTSAPTSLVDLTLAIDSTEASALSATGLAVAVKKGGAVFLWSQGRTSTVQLDDPAWRIDAIADVTSDGRMVGRATNTATGVRGAVLLTPAS